jgi:hypothetical protein
VTSRKKPPFRLQFTVQKQLGLESQAGQRWDKRKSKIKKYCR